MTSECEYLMLLTRILENGKVRTDRTGIGTKSIFGAQMRFNLGHGFPLITTKRIHWKAVVDELLWFISGSTNTKELAARGTHIWDVNGSKDFLTKCGYPDRDEGDLGPVYGFQWRHFGATYTSVSDDYTGQGCDQLAEIISMIKTTPDSRRIVMSAWNPPDIPLMALPPCHVLTQFYVADGELSCQLYQRSADMGLGVPFNIASYALLTELLAHICRLRVGDFIHTIGDAHIYLDHIEPIREQLTRAPRNLPHLSFKRQLNDIDDITAADIELIDYDPHPHIIMKMAV